MLDFNHQPTLSEKLTALIDSALQTENQAQTQRNYLGASRLGVACDRALQYEFTNTAVDEGRTFTGRTLRIFAAGHVFEDLAINWLRQAGFDLYTETASGGQFGFAAVDGRLCGHVDGVLAGGPESIGNSYPALWECRSQAYLQIRLCSLRSTKTPPSCTSSGCHLMVNWLSVHPIEVCASFRQLMQESCYPESVKILPITNVSFAHGKTAAGKEVRDGKR